MLNLIKRHEGYKPFLPETPIQGHIGYYPCGKEEDSLKYLYSEND